MIVSDIEGGEHEIVSAEEDNNLFLKRKSLDLSWLPNFTGFCKARNGIRLPQLKCLELVSVAKLSCLCPASVSNYDTIIQPLFNKKVCFPSQSSIYAPIIRGRLSISLFYTSNGDFRLYRNSFILLCFDDCVIANRISFEIVQKGNDSYNF